MKTFDLTSMGVQEMSALEMQETDGGVFVLIAVAALLLFGASACVNGNTTVIIGAKEVDIHNSGTSTVTADSTSINVPLNVALPH